MSDAVVVTDGAGHDAAVAWAEVLTQAGRRTRVVRVPERHAGTLVGAVRLRRALRRAPGAVVVSVGASTRPWLAVRLAGRRRGRWHAHVEQVPDVRHARWGRLLDPRPRALRRADTVSAAPGVAQQVHDTLGVAVAAALDDVAQLAELATRAPGSAAPGALRLLMLGTVNSPHVEHMALAMRDRGHHVVVAGDVTTAYPPSVLPSAGIDVRPIEHPAMPWVLRLAREVRPDVVHANWLPAYGYLAALMRLRPLVAMAWGSDVLKATPRQQRHNRFVLRRADVAMTDSQALLDRMIELGAAPERSHVVNWGVDLQTFAPAPDRASEQRALGLEPGPLVLSPRALGPNYNPRVILEAFEAVAADVPDARLVLKHLGAELPDLGRPLPPRTEVIGHVPYERLAAYYRAAEVCISIPDSDSSPRTVWEAMACGCACVLSDLPWVHELIEDGRHALVVEPTPAAVADAVRRLLTEPGLAQELGAQARALVERHRDERREMDRLSELYRGVAAQA